jgi:hypothetical protein
MILRIPLIIVGLLTVFSIAGCDKKEGDSSNGWLTLFRKPAPESDFRVELLDAGKGVTIVEYVGSKREIIIPSKIQNKPVIQIGKEAFRAKGLIRINIPYGVITIEDGAFRENQLASVTIPNSVAYIEDNAFYSNPITDITIGADVGIECCCSFGGDGFTVTYYNDGQIAGKYTRPDTNSTTWIKKDNRN